MRAGRVLVGTSGWVYKHWADFYGRVPARRRLEHISRAFPTVEINASFYALPSAETFARWAGQTPPGFVFAVKLSRYLSHVLRLERPEEPVRRMLERCIGLGDRMGPLLLQLPLLFVIYTVIQNGLTSYDPRPMLTVAGVQLVPLDCPSVPPPAGVVDPCIDTTVPWLFGLDISRPETT